MNIEEVVKTKYNIELEAEWEGKKWVKHAWHQGENEPFNLMTYREYKDRAEEIESFKPPQQRKERLKLMRLVSEKNQRRLAELYAPYKKSRDELDAPYKKSRAEIHLEECPNLCCGWDITRNTLPQFDTDE